MLSFFLRRTLNAVILLWLISIIAFWLSKFTPGDEVMDYISIDDRGYHSKVSPSEYRRTYARVASLRGFDLPEFYFSIQTAPDSIQRILPKSDRDHVKTWSMQSGKADASFQLYRMMQRGLFTYCDKAIRNSTYTPICEFFNRSLASDDIAQIKHDAITLRDNIREDSVLQDANKDLSQLISHAENILQKTEARKKGFFSLQWNGTQNQYHRWISGLIHQRPFTSLVDGRNVWTKFNDALKWTLLINGLALLLSLWIGIWIGIWSGKHAGEKIEKLTGWILFALFAVPSFWLATLFIYFLSSGEWLSLFPAGGLGSYQKTENFFEKSMVLVYHFLLPVLCLALGSLAYISRQVRQSVIHEYDQPYVRMLRTQGVSERTILRRHVVCNSLFPVITMTGAAIPALLSGSLIIEVIFSIPGLGRLMYNSLLAKDWPVVFLILMVVAFITVISYTITDLLYKYADPRVKLMDA